MKCPICEIINPDTALRCDCGYDFSTRQMKEPYLPQASRTIMKTSIETLHLLPRIFCILAIVFVSMFAMDAFAPGLTIWQQLGGFFMHLIPSFVLAGVLIVAWKWEFIGGILFMAIGIGLSPFIFMLNYKYRGASIGGALVAVLAIPFPFVIMGILFVVSHYLKKREFSKTPQTTLGS